MFNKLKNKIRERRRTVTPVFLAKVRPNAKIPTKRAEDGCYDIYPALEDGEQMVIKPHSIGYVPTGLKSYLYNQYRISFRERGSNTKLGAIVMAGQIDAGYNGEWFVALYNTTDTDIVITNDSKAICQMAVEYVPDIELCLTDDDLVTIMHEVSHHTRGTGCLGSTGK